MAKRSSKKTSPTRKKHWYYELAHHHRIWGLIVLALALGIMVGIILGSYLG